MQLLVQLWVLLVCQDTQVVKYSFDGLRQLDNFQARTVSQAYWPALAIEQLGAQLLQRPILILKAQIFCL